MKIRTVLFLTLVLLAGIFSNAIAQKWKVGDKVTAIGIVPATVVEVSPTGPFCRVHYESNTYPWNNGYHWYNSSDLKARDEQAKVAIVPKWKVGDKVVVGNGAGGIVPCTVVEISETGLFFRVHYESNTYPWNNGYHWYNSFDLHARDEQAKIDAAEAKGPRPGKYLIYGYPGTTGVYGGYFILKPGGAYEVFLPGDKKNGSGTYSFNSASKTVKWNSGPFADKDWDGTQKFDVERDGKTHIIRLKARTMGSNSTDSN